MREFVNFTFSFRRLGSQGSAIGITNSIRRPSGPIMRSASCAAWAFQPGQLLVFPRNCSIRAHLSSFVPCLGSANSSNRRVQQICRRSTRQFPRECHPSQNVSHDVSAVSHEYANYVLRAETTERSSLGRFGDTWLSRCSPFNLNTNPFLKSFAKAEYILRDVCNLDSQCLLAVPVFHTVRLTMSVIHGEIMCCLAHPATSHPVLFPDGRLLCELGVADAISRSTVDKQRACGPSRGLSPPQNTNSTHRSPFHLFRDRSNAPT